MTKVDGAWKVTSIMPANELPDAVKGALPMFQATVDAMEQTAKEISDGKYKTRDDAVAALKARMHSEP